MVRFHWHVEDGMGACVGPGQLVYLRDHGVLQAMVEIEMPGETPLEACMNIPQNYNTDSGVKELGVVLAHGADASDWRGRLLSELAVSLARAGYLVMRYICHASASESRRMAVFEKTADAAATSPYARGVTRWVLGGLGSGARVAALAGSRLRSMVAGYALLSYPLKEEMEHSGADDSAPGAPPPFPSFDSSGPLLGLYAPVLFLAASTDPLFSEASLAELGPRMAHLDVRSVVLQDVDPHFRTLTGKGPNAATLRAVNGALHEFLNAISTYRMDYCKLPRIWRGFAAGTYSAAVNGVASKPVGLAERSQLHRPACFRPIPTGPPPQAQQPLVMQGTLPYGVSASTAQALAAQIQQRQATGAGVGGHAAQLLAQQVLLHQAAATSAAQRRLTDQADVAPASVTAATATKGASRAGGGATGASGAPNQLAGLVQALSDPSAAAQIAAILLRSGAAGGAGGGLLQVQGTSSGGAGNQALTVEALTSVLLQRLAQQQQQLQQGSAQPSLVTFQSGAASQLLSATLLNQQQQNQQHLQLQGSGAGAGAFQQQQLQHLLSQQHQRQQQRPQLSLQLHDQQALLLQNHVGSLPALQAALRTQDVVAGTTSGRRAAAVAGPGGVLMLQGAGGMLSGAGLQGLGLAGQDVDDSRMNESVAE